MWLRPMENRDGAMGELQSWRWLYSSKMSASGGEVSLLRSTLASNAAAEGGVKGWKSHMPGVVSLSGASLNVRPRRTITFASPRCLLKVKRTLA